MQFKDIIGQEAIKEKLIKSIREDRVAHAQLFLGAQGAGALPLAFAYAQYLNCINKGETDSCGSCSSCRKYSKLIHPDLHLSFPFYPKNAKETALDYAPEWKKAFLENPYLSLDSWREAAKAENKLANINIAECHRIIQTLSLKSFEAEYKVLIMWLPEYLKNNGNALLKLIEEPAPKTLFILVAQQPDQLLNTILSRAQLIKINAPTDAEIEDFFIKNEQVNPQKAKQIAFLSEGNLEKAFQLHRDKSDLAMYEHFRQWILYCYKEDVLGVTEFVDRVLAKPGREQQKSLLSYAISIFREVLLESCGLPKLVRLEGEEKILTERFAGLFTLPQIEAAIAVFEEAIFHIERNANPKILFLDVSLQLVLIIKYQTFPKGTQYI